METIVYTILGVILISAPIIVGADIIIEYLSKKDQNNE